MIRPDSRALAAAIGLCSTAYPADCCLYRAAIHYETPAYRRQLTLPGDELC